MPKRARCPYCDRLFNRDILDAHIERCRDRKHASNEVSIQRKTRKIIVDGNNIAYHLSPHGKPKAGNLALAYFSLSGAGFEPIFVISAALIHNIDSPSSLDSFMMSADVIEAPRGTDDDLRIIQLAEKLKADIVTNDRFLNWTDKFPWLMNRLRRYRMTPTGLILTQ
ncbi:MAG: hypothetical protein ACFFDQ_01170 [Candidatus Thorarchaeota archaeon]